MDWNQYEAYCKQFTGPCGHQWRPGCREGCHTPCEPWSDRPTGHMSPPPHMNFDPVLPPKPIPGDSPMETLNRLYAEVCSTMKKCGELNCKTDQMLKDLHEHGLRNGVYYGPDVIKVEEGYCEEDSSPYKVIRIKHHDKYGAPVEVKMHLAYGNTTNSGIKEKITDASLFELAQVMVPAIGPVDHWNGKVLYQQAPLPSEDKSDGYTYGFTRHGTLKVYKNSFLTENPNALERDSIITAMGCDGVVIRDGSTTTGGDTANVSNFASKAARVMLGQNQNTKELFILDVGGFGEDYPGMTGEHAVKVLMGYGCTIAIQLISGGKSVTLNQGEMLSPPENYEIPENVAYLYISKKCFFKNELQYTIAYLTQMMNQFNWNTHLNNRRMDKLANDLNKEVDDRATGDATLTGKLEQEKKAREDADNGIKEDLQQETDDRINADSELQHNIDEEATTREQEDAKLDEKIQQEAKTRKEEDDKLDAAIKAEAQTRTSEDTRLEGLIDTERTERQEADDALGVRVTDEINRATREEKSIRDALQDEVNRATASETGLGNEIANEANRATSAEADLHADITREQTRALDAEADIKRMVEEMHDDVIAQYKTYTEHLKADVDQSIDALTKRFEGLQETVTDSLRQTTEKLAEFKDTLDGYEAAFEAKIDEVYEEYSNKYNELVQMVVDQLNQIIGQAKHEPIPVAEVEAAWNG